jgi:hypothetical protein
MIKFALMAAMALAATCASANDKPINNAVVLKNLDTAFEEAAAKLGLATVIYGDNCADGPPASCEFNGEGKLLIRGMADTVDSPPSNISLFYEADGNATPLAKNIGLLVSVAEPQMTQKDRGKIIAKIIQLMANKNGGGLVDGVNADFSATRLGDTTIIVAEKAGD